MVLTIATLAWLEVGVVEPAIAPANPTAGVLTGAQSFALGLYVDLAKLLITFATSGVAAVAWLVKDDVEKGRATPMSRLIATAVTLISMLASAFFGLLVVQHIADEVGRDVALGTPLMRDHASYLRLRHLIQGQYYTFVGGLVAFAVLLVGRTRVLGPRDSAPKRQSSELPKGVGGQEKET